MFLLQNKPYDPLCPNSLAPPSRHFVSPPYSLPPVLPPSPSGGGLLPPPSGGRDPACRVRPPVRYIPLLWCDDNWINLKFNTVPACRAPPRALPTYLWVCVWWDSVTFHLKSMTTPVTIAAAPNSIASSVIFSCSLPRPPRAG
jgi:hypothetical protein